MMGFYDERIDRFYEQLEQSENDERAENKKLLSFISEVKLYCEQLEHLLSFKNIDGHHPYMYKNKTAIR